MLNNVTSQLFIMLHNNPLFIRLLSKDRVERCFAYLITVIILLTITYCLIKPSGAPICTLWSTLIVICYMYIDHNKYNQLFRAILFLLLLISVGVYYDGTNVVNRYRYNISGDTILYDESLVRLDTYLLGHIFPYGQIALYLDNSKYIGVNSVIGPYYAEILQLFYVSYYVWGNAVAAWLYYNYLISKTTTDKYKSWRRILMFLTTWTGTFMINFICSLIFPAVSPRLYLRHQYNNEIHGLLLCDLLRAGLTVAAKGTYSAFPSGHCGLSMVAALIAYRCRHMIHRYCVILICIAAVLISLATVVMRYHYFVDFLSSFALVAIGAYWGGWQSDLTYNAIINNTDSMLLDNDSMHDTTLQKRKLTDRNDLDDTIELVVVK